jgi:hypothetical protein
MLTRGRIIPITVTMPIMVMIMEVMDFRGSPISTGIKDSTGMASDRVILAIINIKMLIRGIIMEIMVGLDKISAVTKIEIIINSQDSNPNAVIARVGHMTGLNAQQRTIFVGTVDWSVTGPRPVVRKIMVLTPTAVTKILTPTISPIIPIIIGILTTETEWV